ncbi:MAG: GAF domain-containing sensor histidine kinase, partial [Steroidobacteraceae bacterium]
MRSHDWSGSSVGSPQGWPQALRSMVRILLTSRYQMWMGWGKDLAFFYNDAYQPTLGVKHPWAVGQPASSVWREIWSDIGPLIEHVIATGEATYNEGMLLFLERSGFPEETYHTFSYSPLFDDDGAIAGLLCVVVEETDRIISARRLTTLRQLASTAAESTEQAQLFRSIGAQLNDNLHDLPFTLIYIVDEDGERARLVASSGIQAGHPAAPWTIESGDDIWSSQAVLQTGHPVVLDDLAQRFATLPSGAWQLPPREALIVPISQQGSNRIAGFFVAPINPYRRLDAAFRDFVGLLVNQIAGALASARGFEEERKRAEALAAIDRAKTTFFSNVSHEFRTPLTLMLGPLEELLHPEPRSAAEVRAQAQLAHRNGMRLLRMVNSLLDFSRIEAGRINASFEPTNLSEFCAEIASSFRSTIEKAELALHVNAFDLPQPAYVDREMWEKILLN